MWLSPHKWLCGSPLRNGIVIIPGTPLLTAADMRYRLDRSGASAIVVEDSLMEAVDLVVKDCPSIKAKISITGSETSGSETSGSGTSGASVSWFDLKRNLETAKEISVHEPTRADDEMMIFFTSGTTGWGPTRWNTRKNKAVHSSTSRVWVGRGSNKSLISFSTNISTA